MGLDQRCQKAGKGLEDCEVAGTNPPQPRCGVPTTLLGTGPVFGGGWAAHRPTLVDQSSDPINAGPGPSDFLAGPQYPLARRPCAGWPVDPGCVRRHRLLRLRGGHSVFRSCEHIHLNLLANLLDRGSNKEQQTQPLTVHRIAGLISPPTEQKTDSLASHYG